MSFRFTFLYFLYFQALFSSFLMFAKDQHSLIHLYHAVVNNQTLLGIKYTQIPFPFVNIRKP